MCSSDLNLEPFFTQDYAGPVQILFGVHDEADPAIEVVRALQAKYPGSDTAIVADTALYGANAKISNLINMLPAARHDTLVLSDSDIAVGPKWLAQVTTALARPGVGIVTCLYRGTDPYHYQLWLPKDYASAPSQPRPTIFIAAPGGKAGLGNMADWIQRHGYVAVLLEESRNGDWEPTVGNFLAAHDDVVKRVRVAEGRKVATGMSGAARACSVFVGLRPGFGGLLFQAAGYAPVGPNGASPLPGIKVPAIAATFGEQDPNYAEGPRMKRLFGDRMELFEFRGGHQWAPKETVEEALDSIDARLPK